VSGNIAALPFTFVLHQKDQGCDGGPSPTDDDRPAPSTLHQTQYTYRGRRFGDQDSGEGRGGPPFWRTGTPKESREGLGSVTLKKNTQHTPGFNTSLGISLARACARSPHSATCARRRMARFHGRTHQVYNNKHIHLDVHHSPPTPLTHIRILRSSLKRAVPDRCSMRAPPVERPKHHSPTLGLHLSLHLRLH
jgi:hypothetical protein